MKFFELYDLPVSFLIDEQALKQKYFSLSRQYHPDLFSTADAEKQAEILAFSTDINKGFQVLKDFDKRIKYILMELGAIAEEEKFALPPTFLMEMMDLNELIMAKKLEGDAASVAGFSDKIKVTEDELYEEILPELTSFSPEQKSETQLAAIKVYYYKRKYLQRVRKQIEGKVEM